MFQHSEIYSYDFKDQDLIMLTVQMTPASCIKYSVSDT